MAGVPKLLDLCMTNIADHLLQGDGDDDIFLVIYELPSELFDGLLPHLLPLALHNLQEKLPINFRDSFEPAYDYNGDCRKRRRYDILDRAWHALFKARWPRLGQQKQAVAWLDKVENDDWRQMYWEAHLQDCVDAVSETALLPSYDGSIGEIQIPVFQDEDFLRVLSIENQAKKWLMCVLLYEDGILEQIGCKGHLIKLMCDYLKFSYHCKQFGVYARRLRLPNALCAAETCDLLQSSKLGSLELQWIKSNDHVEGLCKLLNQNTESLKSIEFIHCKFTPALINSICDSLHLEGLQAHGIEHFSIKNSSFLQTDSSPIPVGLACFLTSGRSLRSLILSDDHLGPKFAGAVFTSLLDASASISMLDLSENNISGFVSQFRRRSSSCSLGMGKSLQSIRVLNLRYCNLVREDADSLRQALVHMPNLENLDLSDNSIGDGIRSLVTYFTEISSRDIPFTDLKLENCELTCNEVIELLGVLSNMNKPLNGLSIKGNRLGSKLGAPLGKFLCTGIVTLDVEDIGLGSSGFLEAVNEISKGLKIAYINISNNEGGIGAAKFISSLITHAHKIVAIDASYNLMPMESLSVISSGLKASKGKLEHLDLAGNSFCYQLADAESILAEFRIHGQLELNVSFLAAPNVPYDDDP